MAYQHTISNPVNIYIYIYIYIHMKLKNNIIQKEEFNVKESQRYNVSVLMNHHQDKKGWYQVTLNYRGCLTLLDIILFLSCWWFIRTETLQRWLSFILNSYFGVNLFFNFSLYCRIHFHNLLACLAKLKSSDWTKQSICGWQYIYAPLPLWYWALQRRK